MSPHEDQIDRLLRAAGLAPAAEVPAAVPFGLETRVLAAWRESRSPGFWSTPLLLRGLTLASIIMALCLWPAVTQAQKSTPETDTLQLADSTLQMDNL
jgi:hypothetical protein